MLAVYPIPAFYNRRVAPKHQFIAQIQLFNGLSGPELQALSQRAIERRFAAGREMMLALEAAPTTVAELPLFDGGPYPASVRAVVSKRLRQLVAVVESMTFGSVTQRLTPMLLESGEPEFDVVTHQELA